MPTIVYGLNLLLAAVAYVLVQVAVIAEPGGARPAQALVWMVLDHRMGRVLA